MALRRDFSAEPIWIQEKLVRKVSLKDIEVSLQFLIEQGFLVRGEAQ